MAITTDYPKPDIDSVEVSGQKLRIANADQLNRILWRMWDSIHTLGGRGSSPPILQKPINMNSNRIFGVANQDSPSDDEVLTYGKAQALYAPSVIAKELSIKGSSPLKIENLRGKAAQPQLAWVPTVQPFLGSLPKFGSEMDGWVISDGTYIYQANGVTLEWGNLSALGSTIVGTRGGMGTPSAPYTLYVQSDTGWVYQADSTGASYTFLVGIAFGTDAARLALTISASDNGAIFITTDTRAFWYVSGGSWTLLTFSSAVGSIDLTAQAASIPLTNIVTPALTTQYEISVQQMVNSAGTAGSLHSVIGWTDPQGAKTRAIASDLDLTLATSEADGVIVVRCLSGSPITYQSTVSGAAGAPTYDLFIRVSEI